MAGATSLAATNAPKVSTRQSVCFVLLGRDLRNRPERVTAGIVKCPTIANHESPRTTKLYDRTREELSFDEVERIKSKN
jgi:hypothetical protein